MDDASRKLLEDYLSRVQQLDEEYAMLPVHTVVMNQKGGDLLIAGADGLNDRVYDEVPEVAHHLARAMVLRAAHIHRCARRRMLIHTAVTPADLVDLFTAAVDLLKESGGLNIERSGDE